MLIDESPISDDIQPFRVDVPDSVLDDLHDRLARTRLPNWIDDIGWEQGIEQETYLRLLEIWRDEYDWRAEERRMNEVDHGITLIDRQPVHFVHARSPRPGALPLLLVHGWPGSFHEFLDAIPLLTEPADGGPGFDVVAPDVPGFGFSTPTRERGWDARRTGAAFGELMSLLGYERFGLQGGDVGSGVCQQMARLFPERSVGLHLNFCVIEPYDGAPPPTADEQREMARLATSRQTSMGYFIQQSTKPQTLGIALQDSPAGHLAWISEKLQAWSDSDGDLFSVFTPEQVLTWVTLYWVSGCMTSSLRMYWESRIAGASAPPTSRIEVPTGVVDFPGERARSPKAWVEERFNLVHWTSQPRGGHFAAIEQPVLFASDVTAFFRSLGHR